jgi:hypothetical protein
MADTSPVSEFDEAKGLARPEDAFAAAPEFGFALLLPGHGDFATEVTRDGQRLVLHLVLLAVFIPSGVIVLLKVVEVVLLTPLYVVKRHGSGLRRWCEGVKDESGKRRAEREDATRRKRPTALPYFHGL